MFLSERILNIAPAGAAYFRLKTEFSDGSTKFFPADERSYFVLGDSPFGVAAGVYVLCFYDKHYQALPAFDRSFEMKLESDLHRADQSHLFLHANQAVTPVANGVGESRLNNTPTPGKSQADTHKAEPRNEEGMTAVADLEFQRHMHAMDLEERQQEFIKNSTYVTEVGELFTLNRLMRRELVEMQRLIVQYSQQAYRDIERVKGISRDFLQLQKERQRHAPDIGE